MRGGGLILMELNLAGFVGQLPKRLQDKARCCAGGSWGAKGADFLALRPCRRADPVPSPSATRQLPRVFLALLAAFAPQATP